MADERVHERSEDHAHREGRPAQLGPGELRELTRSGSIAWRLRPFVASAQAEAADVIEALGGEERLTPQRLALAAPERGRDVEDSVAN